MQKPTDVGTNRTGAKASPIDSKRTEEGAKEANTAGPLDGTALEGERVRWARSSSPVGTVPPPVTVKGVVTTTLEALEGHKATVFIDKIAERLAFERTGSRLYDALLAKLEAAHVHAGGPTRNEVEKIRDDERRHYALLRDALLKLGADPTAMTPGADVIGVAGIGWIQVLSDPRTTLSQCLVVMLGAEAADNEGWLLLVKLAEELGFEELAERFQLALQQEEEHAVTLRNWVTTTMLGQSGAERQPRV